MLCIAYLSQTVLPLLHSLLESSVFRLQLVLLVMINGCPGWRMWQRRITGHLLQCNILFDSLLNLTDIILQAAHFFDELSLLLQLLLCFPQLDLMLSQFLFQDLVFTLQLEGCQLVSLFRSPSLLEFRNSVVTVRAFRLLLWKLLPSIPYIVDSVLIISSQLV